MTRTLILCAVGHSPDGLLKHVPVVPVGVVHQFHVVRNGLGYALIGCPAIVSLPVSLGLPEEGSSPTRRRSIRAYGTDSRTCRPTVPYTSCGPPSPCQRSPTSAQRRSGLWLSGLPQTCPIPRRRDLPPDGPQSTRRASRIGASPAGCLADTAAPRPRACMPFRGDRTCSRISSPGSRYTPTAWVVPSRTRALRMSRRTLARITPFAPNNSRPGSKESPEISLIQSTVIFLPATSVL